MGADMSLLAYHLPLDAHPELGNNRQLGERLGFSNVASGPMVRSSYHADLQANPVLSDN